MISSVLSPSFELPGTIAGIARETQLSWVTVRNTLQGKGRIASLDRVRHSIGCRWSWTANTDPGRAGRDLAGRRKARGISQRNMATRLGVSQQTVLALETRFTGRTQTLASCLRVLGLHAVLVLPGRRLVPEGNAPDADLVYTPRDLARAIIGELQPHLFGHVLDPARGEGAFYDAFPAHLSRHWCEISAGRDFLAWSQPVDWVITNPPFSRFRDFLLHAMAVADHVVFLAPLTHFTTRHRIDAISAQGFAPRKIMLVPTPKDWPSSGFQLAAVWLQKGWRGKVEIAAITGRQASHAHP